MKMKKERMNERERKENGNENPMVDRRLLSQSVLSPTL